MPQWLINTICSLTSMLGTLYIMRFSWHFLGFRDGSLFARGHNFNGTAAYIISAALSFLFMVFIFPRVSVILIPLILYIVFCIIYHFCYAGNLLQHLVMTSYCVFCLTVFRGLSNLIVCGISGMELTAVYQSADVHYAVTAVSNIIAILFMYAMVTRFHVNNFTLLFNTKKILLPLFATETLMLFVLVMLSIHSKITSWADPLFYAVIYPVFACCGYILMRYFVVNGAVDAMRVEASEQQLKTQHEYYTKQIEYNESFKRLRHDYKNQLSGLQAYLNSGNTEKARVYLGDLIGELNFVCSRIVTYSDNLFIDAILHKTAEKARQLDTDFSATVQLGTVLHTNDLDICTLFSNIMQNALEACEYVQKERRFIKVTSRIKGSNIVIMSENSYDGVALFKNNVLSTRKEYEASLHGYGLKKVREIVETTCGGSLIIKTDQASAVFTITILLPLTF